MRALILWLRHRSRYRQRVVTFEDDQLFWRFHPFWTDETPDEAWERHLVWLAKERPPGSIDSESWTGTPLVRYARPPWWRPFNAFLHCWHAREMFAEGFHDHPRWTITICLKGEIIEHTPWGTRRLRPGSVVFRSRKAIHAFEMPEGQRFKVWTLFIVGRRNHRQNTYRVTHR